MLGRLIRQLRSRRSAGPSPDARSLIEDADQLAAAGRHAEAVAIYRRSIDIAPTNGVAHNNLGIALKMLGLVPEAFAAFGEAVAQAPDLAEAHYNLASLHIEAMQPGQAMRHLQLAQATYPRPADVFARLAELAACAGDVPEALARYRESMDLDPSLAGIASAYLFSLCADELISPAQLAAEHVRIGGQFAASAGEAAAITDADRDWNPHRRLTLGYISPDFREHSVRYFFEPLIANHDRTRFRVICYGDSPHADAYTESLRQRCDGWRDICGLDHDQAAAVIGGDRPDILIELAGHTGGNRLPLLTRRLAPIQVTALGYPPTTGVAAIDYKISDAVADPVGADRYYSERLLRLPDCFWCYAPPTDCPEPAPSPILHRGHATFGCFGSLTKISADTLAAWRRIFEALPDARLLIKAPYLHDPWVRERLVARLEAAALDLTRITLEGPSMGRDFQRAYAGVDAILDTYPFNGGTTTAHALWMSVPVITHAGEFLLARMGASMLHACGLPQLIAQSWDGYVAAATRLGSDPEELDRLRRSIRPAMAASSLVDGQRYTLAFEAALRKAWDSACHLSPLAS